MTIQIDMIQCAICNVWKPQWGFWGYDGSGKGICHECKKEETNETEKRQVLEEKHTT